MKTTCNAESICNDVAVENGGPLGLLRDWRRSFRCGLGSFVWNTWPGGLEGAERRGYKNGERRGPIVAIPEWPIFEHGTADTGRL